MSFLSSWTPYQGASGSEAIALSGSVVSTLNIPSSCNGCAIQAKEVNTATSATSIVLYSINGIDPGTGRLNELSIATNEVIYLTNREQMAAFKATNAVNGEDMELRVQYFQNARF